MTARALIPVASAYGANDDAARQSSRPDLMNGRECPNRVRAKRRQACMHPFDFVRAKFAAKDLELLDETYHGVSVPMIYRCVHCGYVGRLRFNDLRKSHGCRNCSIKRTALAQKLDFQKFKADQQERGIEVISSVYVNSHTKVELRCVQCQHSWMATPSHIRGGSGCPRCYHLHAAKKRTYTSKFVANVLARQRIILLSDYQTSKKPIRVRFEDCGHEVWTKWNFLQSGRGCSQCSPTRRATEEDYRNTAGIFGGKILAIGSGAQRCSKWRCSLGHIFTRSLTSIRSHGTFCTTCSGSYSEMLCRLAVEKLFGQRFHRARMRGMTSLKGVPLELDIYNGNLRVAVEHNGAHHYEPQENWSGVEGLRIQHLHDRQRRRFCKANDILLVEIRELGKRTSLQELRGKLRRALVKSGRKIPVCFDRANLADLPSLNESQVYWSEVQRISRQMGLKILSKVFLGADKPITIRCECGHVTQKRPRSILLGQSCNECHMERIRKPLRLSDGRVFESGASAATALGVTKEAVNTAVRKDAQCKGMTLDRISRRDFLRLSSRWAVSKKSSQGKNKK